MCLSSLPPEILCAISLRLPNAKWLDLLVTSKRVRDAIDCPQFWDARYLHLLNLCLVGRLLVHLRRHWLCRECTSTSSTLTRTLQAPVNPDVFSSEGPDQLVMEDHSNWQCQIGIPLLLNSSTKDFARSLFEGMRFVNRNLFDDATSIELYDQPLFARDRPFRFWHSHPGSMRVGTVQIVQLPHIELPTVDQLCAADGIAYDDLILAGGGHLQKTWLQTIGERLQLDPDDFGGPEGGWCVSCGRSMDTSYFDSDEEDA